jgi:hypothetical protein
MMPPQPMIDQLWRHSLKGDQAANFIEAQILRQQEPVGSMGNGGESSVG